MEAPPLVRELQFRYNLVQKVFQHVSLWYTIYKSNEQCETGLSGSHCGLIHT